MLTKEDLKKAREAYDAAIEKAERQRAETVARAIAEGLPQKDVIEAMEYSRETVRRITQAGNALLRASANDAYQAAQELPEPGPGWRSDSSHTYANRRPSA